MLLIATSGPLGKALELNPLQGIWWRALFSLFFIGVFIFLKGWSIKMHSFKDLKIISLGGILMAAHWVTYFFALQWAGVAIGMLSLFTYPVITAFLEPVLLKVKFDPKQLILALLICVGIYLIVPDFNFSNSSSKGLLIGLLSAFFYALRNISLKRPSSKYPGSVLMGYQMLATLVILAPSLFLFDIHLVKSQLPILLALALFTTTIGHTLFISSFKYFSISTASILSSVQPVFGIVMAFLFLGEVPALTTIIGGLIILSTVVVEGLKSK